MRGVNIIVKIETLKDLIEKSKLSPKEKVAYIKETLQKSEDGLRAKFLSEEILKGNFEDIEEQGIND